MPLKDMLATLLLTAALTATVSAQTYEEYVARGIELAGHDSLPQAEAQFRQALQLRPNDYRNALLYTDLGRVQEAIYWQDTHNTTKADEAMESYSLALASAPEAVPMLMARGTFLLKLGMHQKAIVDFTRIVTVNEQHAQALSLRAYCHAQLREYGDARADYNRALAIEPDNYEAALGLAILEQQTGHLNKGIERMTQLIETEPQQAELYSVRAGMYAENKQLELALLDLDEAVGAAPQNVNYLLARAYLHQQQGDKRRALRDFEQAIDLGIPRASLAEELKACR